MHSEGTSDDKKATACGKKTLTVEVRIANLTHIGYRTDSPLPPSVFITVTIRFFPPESFGQCVEVLAGHCVILCWGTDE